MADGNEDDLDPVDKVMSNSLLLQNIIRQVNIKETSLKQLRLVSTQWNDIILSLPEPRIRLIVNNLWVQNSWNPIVFTRFISTMEPKLARCIEIVSRATFNKTPQQIQQGDHCWTPEIPDHLHGFRIESAGYVNLKQCIELYSEEIHTLDLWKSYVKLDYVPILHRLLQSECPNLSKLRLSADSLTESMDLRRQRPLHVSKTWRNQNFENLSTLIGGQIPIKSKLKSISFELFENHGSTTPRSTTGPLHNLYQAIISASPNLKGLRQDFIVFPDCSAFKELKSLNFRIQLFRSDFDNITGNLQVPFDLAYMTRMLQDIADSVTYLKIEVNHLYCSRPQNRDCVCRDQLRFVMPPMMKLQVFRCSDFDILFGNEIGGNIPSIRNVNRIGMNGNEDSLQVIEIGRNINGHVPGIAGTVTDLCQISMQDPIAKNVDTVIINGISVFDALEHIRLPFPAIDHLVINKHFRARNQQDVNGSDISQCQLAELLKVCDYITLTSLTCTIPFPSKFSTFVMVLHNNIPYFEEGYLKELVITGTGTTMEMDSGNDNDVLTSLEQVFFSMRDMNFVKFIDCPVALTMKVCDRLWEFIRNNNLPIDFP